jgi:serine protease inhibitor
MFSQIVELMLSVVLRADKSVLDSVRDEATGSILFMGRVTQPK